MSGLLEALADAQPLSLAILLFVTVQRLGELILARRNTQRLLARGAREAGGGHYPVMVSLHASWLAGLWWLAPAQEASLPLLAIFALLQLARLWVIATLGERWTTRIIVMPSAPLVRSGPYRFVSHPNYWVVAGEIAVLPLVFGLSAFALIFSALNALMLWWRIRAEEAALRGIAPAAASTVSA
jgi:methyltransferase